MTTVHLICVTTHDLRNPFYIRSVQISKSKTNLLKTFELYDQDIRQRRHAERLDSSRLILVTCWAVPAVTCTQLQTLPTVAESRSNSQCT